VFAEKGFGAATIDEIVRVAEVSKPALYRAYESKSHLYSALIEQHAIDTAQVALGALTAAKGTIQERLPTMIAAWFDHVKREPELFRLLHRDVPADLIVAAACTRIKALQVANDVGLLRQFAPELPADEIVPLGEVLRSALVALATWWLDHPEEDLGLAVRAMVRVCNGLLLTVENS
jgi:AcrR family transcriptional regulator